MTKESDLVFLMKARAEAVQAVVKELKNLDEVFKYTISLTRSQEGKTLAVSGLNMEQINQLKNQCTTHHLELLLPPFRPHMTRIHTALTPADRGIAETGTLVLDSSNEDLRIASMLCETHVAFLWKSHILPDMQSVIASLTELLTVPPTYLSFITGPSRTADIERVLTIGVHGPQNLHILIIGE